MDKSVNLLVDLTGQDPLSCQKHHLFQEDPAIKQATSQHWQTCGKNFIIYCNNLLYKSQDQRLPVRKQKNS